MSYLTNLQSINHQITITQAATLIARFDANEAGILDGDFQSTNPFTKSQTFELGQVVDLLNQTGCVALRAYFGMYDEESAPDAAHEGKIVLVLCGVDENGNDLNLGMNSTVTGQIILEVGQLCPSICSSPSQINNL
jgi:hypothetical protein